MKLILSDGPTMIVYPKTTSGDKMNAVMLFCVVDSNPPPNYHWTKGSSREVRLNLVLCMFCNSPFLIDLKLSSNCYHVIHIRFSLKT